MSKRYIHFKKCFTRKAKTNSGKKCQNLVHFMKQSKIFGLILLHLFAVTLVYANGVTLKITIETVSDSGEKMNIIIYQGSPGSELLDLIKNAKPIRTGNVEKAVISEGCYFVEFFDGREEKKYSIQNNYWIYDINNEKFLRCAILSNLRGYLLRYLFSKVRIQPLLFINEPDFVTQQERQ